MYNISREGDEVFVMNIKLLPVIAILFIGLCGCHCSKKQKKTDVISQRYIHKYGYDVSRDEWNGNHYPGQVVTTLKNGVTIASTYEDGVLHGPTSYTYPHSQTLESLQIYERGNLIKKASFDIKGIPQKEELFLAPTHVKTKYWYRSGTPMCVEQYLDGCLIEGEYYTLQNEIESRVENASGVKVIRSQEGLLLAKEILSGGEVIRNEIFHSNGTPHIITAIKNGVLHGEKKVFAPSGDPISAEHYYFGQLDGMCSYYQNGYRYLETPYRDGRKDGIERRYIDGETLIEETEYHADLKHGPSIFYTDGISKTEWYYNDELISKVKFEELAERERVISMMNSRVKPKISDEDEESMQIGNIE
jgi:antitoxin component YwqK of YwqJK toxin-antitoxin module